MCKVFINYPFTITTFTPTINIVRVDQETWEWYKALPKGTKAKILREAISLYRNQNKTKEHR